MTARLVAVPAREPHTRTPAPIVDQRSGRGWGHGLLQRLTTAVAWGGTGWLLGPLALKALLITGLGAGLGLPLLERRLARRALASNAAPTMPPPAEASAEGPAWSQALGRLELAEAFGLPEATLFRARHARICRVEHDEHGRIQRVSLPAPSVPQAHHDRDAHPVG